MIHPPTLAGVGAVIGWVGAAVYQTYKLIEQDGTWYNDLYREDRFTFWNRAKYTLRNRIKLLPTIGIVLLGSVVMYVVAYIFVTGLIEVLT